MAAILVQHLERISGDILDEYPRIIQEFIRRRSGIYALYHHDRLYYVGLASNLMGRLKSHLKDRHERKWDTFSVYLTPSGGEMKLLESLVLRIATPVGNRVQGKLGSSQNLTRTLRTKMSEADADKRAKLLGGAVARHRRRVKTRTHRGSLPLAGLTRRRIPLRGRYKGQVHRASLLTNGKIRFDGKMFDSPSAAAEAARGRGTNGWHFWTYRNEKRHWVKLSEMRR